MMLREFNNIPVKFDFDLSKSTQNHLWFWECGKY